MSQKSIEFDIRGMTCASCSARIEHVLNRLHGIEASVNLSTEKAFVNISDSSPVDSQKIIETIQKAGFTAQLSQGADNAKREEQKQQEHERFMKEFLLSAIFTAPFILQMSSMFSIKYTFIIPPFVQLLVAGIVQFYLGRRFFVGAYKSLRGGGANMDVLVAMGTGAAYIFSCVVFLFSLNTELYFEVSATVVTLVLMGKVLEARAKRKTGFAISNLLKMRPKSAFVERNGAMEQIDANRLVVGDIFVVKAGETVPTDAIVMDGAAVWMSQ